MTPLIKSVIKYATLIIVTAILTFFVAQSYNKPDEAIKDYFKEEMGRLDKEMAARDSAMLLKLNSIAKGDTTIINNRNFYYEVQSAKDSLIKMDSNNVYSVARWVIKQWDSTITANNKR